MVLKNLQMQHFRSYTQAHFRFSAGVNCVIGRNTAGKTNLVEAINLLATGKSFHAEKEVQMIQLSQEIARVKADIEVDEDKTQLEIVIAQGSGITGISESSRSFVKKYLVNNIPKRRLDFAGKLKTILFTPADLELIVGGPSNRRNFLDEVLEQVDYQYRQASISYARALRQRNALLEHAKETGQRSEQQFVYWDELLIKSGQYLTKRREAIISFLNQSEHTVLPFLIEYEHSSISEERLTQYAVAEVAAGVTLVGPHRDDFSVHIGHDTKAYKNVRAFGSRGQQRLVVLQLKILQLTYMKQELQGEKPLLILDDIFSELDSGHIALVLAIIQDQQTILTTTHKEFLQGVSLPEIQMIELEK